MMPSAGTKPVLKPIAKIKPYDGAHHEENRSFFTLDWQSMVERQVGSSQELTKRGKGTHG